MDLSLLLSVLPADLATTLAVHLHTAADAVAEKNSAKLSDAGSALLDALLDYLEANNIDLGQAEALLKSVIGIDFDLASIMDTKKGAPN